MSPLAREKANLPILYDAKASHVAAFAVWGPMLQRIDPCSSAEAAFAPASREGGPYSAALSGWTRWAARPSHSLPYAYYIRLSPSVPLLPALVPG